MAESNKLQCSFCGKNDHEVKKLIAGPNVYICDECVNLCYSILDPSSDTKTPQKSSDKTESKELLSPSKIKEFMDQYIVGQDYAKMVVSVAVHNHYKRLNNPVVDDVELEKSNILMVGPTGSGKTHIAQTIAKVLDVPFAMADATSLTEAGYVGDDVESIVTKLYQAAGGDVAKCERGIIYLDEIDKKHKKEGGGSGSRDVSGEGVQQALLKIIEGSEVMVPASGNKKSPSADMVKINTKNILFIVGGAFVGLDKVIKKNANKNAGVGFNASVSEDQHINELMKLAQPSDMVKFGIIPELIGRLPVIAPLEELSTDQLVRVLTEPKNAVIKQFEKLFELGGVKLEFEPEALTEVAKAATARKTGARGLRSVIEKVLIKTQFHLPDMKEKGATKVIVTPATITKDEEPQIVYGDQNQTAE